MENIIADEELDTKGLFCPEPVMMLHAKMDEMAEGEILLIVATDPSTTRDVPKFCKFLGHDLLSSTEDADAFYYWIKKEAGS